MPQMKKGLDYFPLSVDLLNEYKLRRPKMRYGYLAVVVYISLLCQLYRDEGYYIDYRDPDAVIWQVQSDLQGKYQPDQDTVAEVIAALAAAELFSPDLFQREIITSKAAQRNYYRATVDRKTVDIDDSIWLLTADEMEALSAKHCYYLKTVNRAKNSDNRAKNPDNRAKNPQSKVKESKEEDIKPPALPEGAETFSPALQAAFADWLQYKQEKRQNYKPVGLRRLVTHIKDKAAKYGEAAVIELINESMANNWQGIIWDRLGRGGRSGKAKSGEPTFSNPKFDYSSYF